MQYYLPEGWFNNHDITVYRNLVNRVPDNSTIIEVGVWKGRSICSIADILIKKNLKVIAIDTFKGSEEHKDIDVSTLKEEFLQNLINFCIADRVLTITGTLQESISEPSFYKSNNDISMIFIDADHSTEAVKLDYESALTLKEKYSSLEIIAGHDITWQSVQKALPLDEITSCGNMWWKSYHSVVVTIPTNDRYKTTLPITLTSVINQTYIPDEIIIFDTNENSVDLRTVPLYQELFRLAFKRGVSINVILLPNSRQAAVHKQAQSILKKAVYIWRVDDDTVPAPDNLELSVKDIKMNRVGAVGGYFNNDIQAENQFVSFDIKDMPISLNVQWTRMQEKVINMDHLYSNFLYKRDLGNCDDFYYHLREETHQSVSIALTGAGLVFNGDIKTEHLQSPPSKKSKEVDRLEYLDCKHFKEVNKVQYNKYLKVHSGIGDKFAAVEAAKNYAKIFTGNIYLDLGLDNLPENSLSLPNNVVLVHNIQNNVTNVYEFMAMNNWNKNLVDAYKTILNNQSIL